MSLPHDSVYRLPLTGVNAYLVDDGEYTLVDAGTPWDANGLRRLLWEAGVVPRDLDRVLLTHFDLDHVGTLADLDPRCPVHVAEPDGSYLRGTRRPPLSNHKGLLQRALDRFIERPDLDLREVRDGEAIGGFRAHHTPGHTPGHTAYVHVEYGVAMLGDLVRGSGDGLAAPPWVVTADPSENRRSIERLADRVEAFEVAAVGHGDPVRRGGRDALERLAAGL